MQVASQTRPHLSVNDHFVVVPGTILVDDLYIRVDEQSRRVIAFNGKGKDWIVFVTQKQSYIVHQSIYDDLSGSHDSDPYFYVHTRHTLCVSGVTNENDRLGKEVKRMHDSIDDKEDGGDEEEEEDIIQTPDRRICTECQWERPMSSFREHVNQKNKKTGDIKQRVTHRTICNSCRSRKYKKKKVAADKDDL